jgi:hypothetical protein
MKMLQGFYRWLFVAYILITYEYNNLSFCDSLCFIFFFGLQILLTRGIVVEEIKLYGAEEDNEMIPDSSESSFEDLENVIANVRCSIAVFSTTTNE